MKFLQILIIVLCSLISSNALWGQVGSLSLTGLDVLADTANIGSFIEISTTISNSGDTPAAYDYIDYYVSTDTVLNGNDVLLGSMEMPITPENSSITQVAYFDSIPPLETGAYYVLGIHNSPYSDNHVLYDSVYMHNGIDLQLIPENGFPISSIYNNTSVNVDFTVQNSWAAAVTNATYNLSATVYDESTSLIGEVYSQNLENINIGIGETYTISDINFDFSPLSLSPGNYSLIIRLQPAGSSNEANLDNNVLYYAFSVLPGNFAPSIDNVKTAYYNNDGNYTIMPDTIRPYYSLELGVWTHNTSNANIFYLHLLFDIVPLDNPNDTIKIERHVAYGLWPNTEAVITIYDTWPSFGSNYPEGFYQMTVSMFDSPLPPSAPYTFYYQPIDGSIQNITATPTQDGGGGMRTIDYTADYVPIFDYNTPLNDINFYLQPLSNNDTIPLGLHSFGTPILVPNELPAGNYNLIAKVDGEQAYVETNETNNTATTIIALPSSPITDLSLSGIQIPDTLYTLTPQDAIWQITNEGSNPLIAGLTGALTVNIYPTNNDSLSYAYVFTTPFIDELPAINSGQSASFQQEFYLSDVVYPPNASLIPIQVGDYNICLEWTSTYNIDNNQSNNRFCQPVHIAYGDVYQVSNALVTPISSNELSYSATINMTTQQYYVPYSFVISTDTIPSADDYLLTAGDGFQYDNPYDGSVDVVLAIPPIFDGNYYVIAQYGYPSVQFTATTETNPNVFESTYANNSTISAVALAYPANDISIFNSALFYSTADNNIQYDFYIQNTTSQNAYYAVYLSTDDVFNAANDLLLYEGINNDLPQQFLSNLSYLPNGLAAGTYHVFFVVDNDNSISESNENNNIVSNSFVMINISNTYELAITEASIPTYIQPGQPLPIQITVSNLGALPEQLYNVIITVSGLPSGLETQIIPVNETILSGENGVYNFSTTLASDYPEGSYNVAVTINPEHADQIDNNTINSVFTITGVTNNPLPNLRPELYYLPQYASPGQTFNLPYRVKNDRPYPSAPSHARLYFSDDYSLSTTNDYLIAEIAVPALEPLQTYDNTLLVAIPDGYSSSNIVVFMEVDINDEAEETNEADNISYASMQVAGNSDGVIDLMLDNVQAPLNATPGQSIATSVRVWNFGNANAPISKVKYYLSNDVFVSDNDIYLGEKVIPAITASGISTFLQTLSIPTTASPATYYLVAYVDPEFSIGETNENNNFGYRQITVTENINTADFADLQLSLQATPSPNVSNYSFVTYTLTLTNAGNIAAHDIEVAFAKPQNLAYTSDTAYSSQTTGIYLDYNYWFGKLFVSQLNPNQTVTVELNLYHVTSQDSIHCFAQVTALNEFDTDSSPDNNSGNIPAEDDEAAVTLNGHGQTGGKNANAENQTHYPVHLNSLQPNPSSAYINLNMYSTQERDLRFNVYNAAGHIVATHTRHVAANINTLQFDVQELSEGLYFIQSEWNELPIRFVKY